MNIAGAVAQDYLMAYIIIVTRPAKTKENVCGKGRATAAANGRKTHLHEWWTGLTATMQSTAHAIATDSMLQLSTPGRYEMVNLDEKREYLKRYRVLAARAGRMREMAKLCPENTERYNCDIKETIQLRDNIEKAVNAIDGGVLTEILSLKYICGKSLEEISFSIGYSKRQTERLHIRALQRLCIT